jgi:hypothetical protein
MFIAPSQVRRNKKAREISTNTQSALSHAGFTYSGIRWLIGQANLFH